MVRSSPLGTVMRAPVVRRWPLPTFGQIVENASSRAGVQLPGGFFGAGRYVEPAHDPVKRHPGNAQLLGGLGDVVVVGTQARFDDVALKGGAGSLESDAGRV